MVGLGRFELPTSPLSGVRSNQLSYRPGIPAQITHVVLTGAELSPTARLLRTQECFEDRLNMLGSYAADDHRS
jgi:hypothetical protein